MFIQSWSLLHYFHLQRHRYRPPRSHCQLSYCLHQPCSRQTCCYYGEVEVDAPRANERNGKPEREGRQQEGIVAAVCN